tara:strand:+ start:44 stop:568 length:525 start_codon:yes stop_codon:yes gene_type:complete
MRLYAGKVTPISNDMFRALTGSGAVEPEPEMDGEVLLDIESVLKEYIRTDREIVNQARETISQGGLEFRQLHKIKNKIADERGFGIGDKAMDYLTRQIIECLFHSRHVAEIYVEDNELRRQLRTVLRQHLKVDDELDQEVRKRIQNLQEGTSNWEIEYNKVMTDLKRIKGLEPQ